MRGRPPLTNVVRRKDGKSMGPPVGIHPETLAVRERQLLEDGIILSFGKTELGREIIKRTADDRLSGFTLGRLLLRYRQDKSNPGGISETQFEAGETWNKIVHRHARIHGYNLSVKTPSFIMVSFGKGGGAPDNDDEYIREQWQACYNAIVKICAEQGSLAVRDILYGVVIEDWPISRLTGSTQRDTDKNYGDLREGLNALVRALR